MIMVPKTAGVPAMPLGIAPEQPEYMVERVSGPEQRRLSEMGFVAGTAIQVVNRARNGMLVVKVGGSRLALARGMADFVWVK